MNQDQMEARLTHFSDWENKHRTEINQVLNHKPGDYLRNLFLEAYQTGVEVGYKLQAMLPDEPDTVIMKYYALTLTTRCGEHEFSQVCAIRLRPGQILDQVTAGIRDDWYEGELDYVDSEGVAWFGNGNATCIDRITEITEDQYTVLNQFI